MHIISPRNLRRKPSKIKLYFLWILAFGLTSTIPFNTNSQTTNIEVRGAWLTTLSNIDWPSKQGLSEPELKHELIQILNFYQNTGINTIFFQVRPAGDVFYKSSYEPWSKYITGNKGQSPPGNFDPLQFLLDEGHKRCMEVHAWINPFRVLFNPNPNEKEEYLNYHNNSHWYVYYGNHLYLNPGEPEVRTYVIEIIKDLAETYDVDGIHFDDYFYPYPKNNKSFDDATAFQNYADTTDLDAWRRSNIDDFIFKTHQYLNSNHPFVKFGVSPFGVWENKSAHFEGSNTSASITSYSTNYANILQWLDKGWIDYAIPQLYWNIGFEAADFAVLTKWWNMHSHNRHLYIGHSNYKFNINSNISAWQKGVEISKQFENIELYPNLNGSVFFNTNTLMKNPVSSTDSIRAFFKRKPARIPQMKYKKQLDPTEITNVKCKKQNDQITIFWKTDKKANPNFGYAIYKSSSLEGGSNFQLLKTIPGHLSVCKIPMNEYKEDGTYYFKLGAFSRTHKERIYDKAIKLTIKGKKVSVKVEKAIK